MAAGRGGGQLPGLDLQARHRALAAGLPAGRDHGRLRGAHEFNACSSAFAPVLSVLPVRKGRGVAGSPRDRCPLPGPPGVRRGDRAPAVPLRPGPGGPRRYLAGPGAHRRGCSGQGTRLGR